METMRLLIADSSDDFRNSLSKALQGQYRVQCCGDGKEALRLMKTNPPDILVLDLMLPELDGISLLYAAIDHGIHPMVLATTLLANEYAIRTAEKLGVGYLILKPCDIRATVERIRDLSSQISLPPGSAPDTRTHISNILTALGISSKLRGYIYIREAVLLMIQEPLQSITKELYPNVASICKAEASQVERSIRSAITSAWNHRDDHVWCQFFSPDANGTIPRPSNACLISRIADQVVLDQISIPLE